MANPRPEPHPFALFSLIPKNDRAREVVNNPCNQQLTSKQVDGTLGLDIGHVLSKSGDSNTLATLGRDGDIIVGGASIAKIQCSFEINRDTNVVMFYDRSHTQSSQVFGPFAIPFEYGRTRKVVVHSNLNTIIGMGGVGRNLVEFELIWHSDAAETMKRVEERGKTACELNPCLARTIDDTDTVLPSGRETRIHTPGPSHRNIRPAIINQIGTGQFGVVYKAVDVDSGRLMALKRLRKPPGRSDQEWRTLLSSSLKREVHILSRMNHPHIVDYIASEGWSEGKVKIMMGLKEGTLQSLLQGRLTVPINDLAVTVFHHMLQALDCLSGEGIVHRDIKPENILYVTRSNEYHFQLGDFGLSNHQIVAQTFAGSLLYMAPELFQGKQTHKADVWALCVTMLWTLDVEGFREAIHTFESVDNVINAVVLVSKSPRVVNALQEMAEVDPEKRASAAQMLVKSRPHSSSHGSPPTDTPNADKPNADDPKAGEPNADRPGRRPKKAKPTSSVKAAPHAQSNPDASLSEVETELNSQLDTFDMWAPQHIHDNLDRPAVTRRVERTETAHVCTGFEFVQHANSAKHSSLGSNKHTAR
ncbi:kinase-like protein [Xylaria sp. FL1777]|nr:kinase-like protein [Xylaria sp. FL1777]